MYTVIGPPTEEVIEAFGQKHARPEFAIRFPDGKTEIHYVKIQGVIRTAHGVIVTGYIVTASAQVESWQDSNFFVLPNYFEGTRGGGKCDIEDSMFHRYWGIHGELQMHMLGVSCNESLKQ